MIGMWDGRYVGCLGCGIFGMWNDPDVGYGMWDGDLHYMALF